MDTADIDNMDDSIFGRGFSVPGSAQAHLGATSEVVSWRQASFMGGIHQMIIFPAGDNQAATTDGTCAGHRPVDAA
jgi:hypothetical protein